MTWGHRGWTRGPERANAAGILGKRVGWWSRPRSACRINSGTVPSKTLRERRSRSRAGARASSSCGPALRREATVSDFTRHKDRVTSGSRQLVDSRLRERGVERFVGTAAFANPERFAFASKTAPRSSCAARRSCATVFAVGPPSSVRRRSLHDSMTARDRGAPSGSS